MANLTTQDLIDYIFASNIVHFLFCFFAVLYIFTSVKSKNNSYSRRVFKSTLVFVFLALFFDLLSYVFDMRDIPGARVINHISMIGAILFTAVLGGFWHRFFDVLFHIEHKRPKSVTLLYFSSAILLAICLVVNGFTGFIFYIDDANVYHRGGGYWLSFILQYVSYLMLIVRAVLKRQSIKTSRYVKMRNGVISLGAVSIFFGILQAVTYGRLALHCFGITAGALVIFQQFQDDRITHDMLTGLNNRYALDSFAVEKMRLYQSGTNGQKTLWFIMMDVNDFKYINDEYGHIEGDEALKRVGESLKKVGSKHTGLFLSRFGGDEFAAIYETRGEANVKSLCEQIKETLIEDNRDLAYPLTIGVGFAKYKGADMPLDMLYDLADKALYIDKNSG